MISQRLIYDVYIEGLDVRGYGEVYKTVYVICENHCILPNMDTEFTCYFLWMCNQVALVFDWMAQKDVPIWFWWVWEGDTWSVFHNGKTHKTHNVNNVIRNGVPHIDP